MAVGRPDGQAVGEVLAAAPTVPAAPAVRGAWRAPAARVQVQVQRVADVGLAIMLLLCEGTGGTASVRVGTGGGQRCCLTFLELPVATSGCGDLPGALTFRGR